MKQRGKNKFRGINNKNKIQKEDKKFKGRNKNGFKSKRKKEVLGKGGSKQLYCFNRYRDKDVVAEELERKRKLEQTLQQETESEESEVEVDNPLEQLLGTFSKDKDARKKKSLAVDSSEEELDDEDEVMEENEDEMDLDEEAEEEEEEINESGDDNGEQETNETDNVECKPEEINVENEETIDEKEIDHEIENSELLNKDPFEKHLNNDLSDSLLKSVSNTPQITVKKTANWPHLKNIIFQIPKENAPSTTENKKIALIEQTTYASEGTIPERIVNVDWDALNIKKQLHKNLLSANENILNKNELEIDDKLTGLQRELFSVMNNYQDLYYPQRTFTNGEEIRFAYCLHVVNHILKTRTKILHHNAKLVKKNIVPDEYRDQGLVRPKIVIIVPFRDAAYRIVQNLIQILVPGDSSQVINKNRFEQDFTGNEIIMPKKNAKPEDYELTFRGNTDDTFRIGLSVTKKSLKLYTEFYSSDIIIASPLGLRVIVGAEGEEERDFDFLASVELLILDQTELFLMQNWDHLLHIIDHFHLQPKKTHGTDFSRLRSWAINGWTKYYRQTLIFSSIQLPEINSLFNKKCFNYAGKVRINNPIESGSIRQVAVQVPQVFKRIECKDPLSAIDARFNYFIKEILPQYKDTIMTHTMIYVPSYFDYVRIRNYFKREDISFVQICEYSKDAKIARARDMFFHSDAHFLLYSERFHFFRRMRIKGIRHIIFYQPPIFPHFYPEMCNLMQEANQNKFGGSESNMTVTVMYTKYDLQQLSGLIGSEKTIKMSQSERDAHMFMTGE